MAGISAGGSLLPTSANPQILTVEVLQELLELYTSVIVEKIKGNLQIRNSDTSEDIVLASQSLENNTELLVEKEEEIDQFNVNLEDKRDVVQIKMERADEELMPQYQKNV